MSLRILDHTLTVTSPRCTQHLRLALHARQIEKQVENFFGMQKRQFIRQIRIPPCPIFLLRHRKTTLPQFRVHVFFAFPTRIIPTQLGLRKRANFLHRIHSAARQ